MSTIVVESQTSGAGNAPKVNVFVQNKNGSESNSDETKSQEPVFGVGKAIKSITTLLQPNTFYFQLHPHFKIRLRI
jgi:hypothetical protein